MKGAFTFKESSFLLVSSATVWLYLLPGCSKVVYETVTLADSSSQSTVHRATGDVLIGFPFSQKISLNAERHTLPNGRKLFYLLLEYFSDSVTLKEWLDIQPAEPLILRIDGRLVRLPGAADRYTRQTIEEQPLETAAYETPVELLEMLAGATEVIVRVRCSRQTIERNFEKDNFQFFRRFVDEFRQ